MARLQEELQQKQPPGSPADRTVKSEADDAKSGVAEVKHEEKLEEIVEEKQVEVMETEEEKAPQEDDQRSEEVSPSKKGKSRGKRMASEGGEESKSIFYNLDNSVKIDRTARTFRDKNDLVTAGISLFTSTEENVRQTYVSSSYA